MKHSDDIYVCVIWKIWKISMYLAKQLGQPTSVTKPQPPMLHGWGVQQGGPPGS